MRREVVVRRIVNVCGAVGYTLLVFVMAISVTLLMLRLIQSGSLALLGIEGASLDAATESQCVDDAGSIPDTPLLAILRGVISVLALGAALSGLVMLPYWLGRSASRVTKRVIRLFHCAVTLRSLLVAKIVACSLCGGAIMMSNVPPAVMIALLGLTGMALVIFLIQHYIAAFSKFLAAKDVW